MKMKENRVGSNVARKVTVPTFVVKMDTVAGKTQREMAVMD